MTLVNIKNAVCACCGLLWASPQKGPTSHFTGLLGYLVLENPPKKQVAQGQAACCTQFSMQRSWPWLQGPSDVSTVPILEPSFMTAQRPDFLQRRAVWPVSVLHWLEPYGAHSIFMLCGWLLSFILVYNPTLSLQVSELVLCHILCAHGIHSVLSLTVSFITYFNKCCCELLDLCPCQWGAHSLGLYLIWNNNIQMFWLQVKFTSPSTGWHNPSKWNSYSHQPADITISAEFQEDGPAYVVSVSPQTGYGEKRELVMFQTLIPLLEEQQVYLCHCQDLWVKPSWLIVQRTKKAKVDATSPPPKKKEMLSKIWMYSCWLAHGDRSTERKWYQYRPADLWMWGDKKLVSETQLPKW